MNKYKMNALGSTKPWSKNSKQRNYYKTGKIPKENRIINVMPPNKDDPDYVFDHYAKDGYSPKQERILAGEVPLENIRLNELTVIINRALYHNDMDAVMKARALREQKIYNEAPDEEKLLKIINSQSHAEAKAVLDSLTPQWIRNNQHTNS